MRRLNLLHSSRFYLEFSGYVAPKHAGLKSLDMTTNISFGCQKVALVHIAMRLVMSVRHDNMAAISFDLIERRRMFVTPNDMCIEG
jgi:hypothetical protein